jgi:hypothetical protein
MKFLLLSGTAGGFIILNITFLPAQAADSTISPVVSSPAKQDVAKKAGNDTHWLWRDASISGGQLTLPFKIRESPENHTFRLTTDVTLGGYVGYTRKISKKKDFYLTIPLTAGITFINLTNNNTALTITETDAEVIPGLTWSTGLIFQLEQYSFGLMIGKDYASEVGDQWQYHGKLWWSFGIGFVFLQ